MDIDLGPGIDGTQAAERILEHKDIPVVFLSSHTEPEVVEKTEKITSYGYVVKNTGVTVLDASIKMALKLFEARMERGRAEDDLRESEERKLSDIIQFLPDAALAIDRNKRVIVWNRAIEEMTGIPAAEMIGQGDYAYSVPFYGLRRPQLMDHIFDDSAEIAARYPAVTRQGDALMAEVFCNALYSGRGAWVFAKASPLYDMSGQIIGSIEIIRDITERRRTMDALRMTQFATDCASDAIYWVGQDGQFHYVNEAACHYLGYARDELLGMKVYDIDPDYTRDVYSNHWRELKEKGKLLIETRHRAKDGHIVPVEISVYYFAHDDKEYNIAFAREITARKKVEEALRESEVKFRTLHQSMMDAFVNVEMDGRIIDCNEIYLNMLGYTREEVGKLTYQDFTPEKWHAFEAAIIQEQVLPKGYSDIYEKEYQRKDGTVFPVELRITLIRDTDGSPVSMWAIVRDITGRKQSEKALRQSEALFRNLFQKHTAVKLLIDPDSGHIEDANMAAEAFYGWSREELRRMNISEINTLSPEQVKAEMEKVRAEKRTYFEFKHRRADGSIRDVAVFSSKTEYEGKDLLHSIIHDITERKRAEMMLKASETRFRMIYEYAPVMIDCFDSEGRCVLWNRACEQTFGWSIDEINSSPEPLALFYPDPDVRREVVTTVVTSPNPEFREWHPQTRDGRKLDCMWANYMLDDGLVMNIGYDITERKRVEEEVQKQLSEKEILLKEIHHRVKNNIANIECLLSMHADSHSNPEVRSALQDAISRIQSMRVLYDNLLIGRDYHEVNLLNYAESLIDSIASVFREGGKITIEKKIADFTLPAKKAISVGIIINELLTNAFKYAFKGRENGLVSINLEKKGNTATLTVHDNGIGIDEKIQSNRSSGLGMMLVKMLTEQLNGTCSIRNDNGTKSVIRFEA